MIFFRSVGFFLVVVAFYSFGAVAGEYSTSMTREKATSPSSLDLATIILSWLIAWAAYRSNHRGALATTLGAGVGLLAAFILQRTRNQGQRDEHKGGDSRENTPTSRADSIHPITPYADRSLRPGWRLFARRVGRFQSGLFLIVFYYIAIMPFGIVAGTLGDPLGLKAPPGESFWKSKEAASASLEGARRQS